MKLDLNTLTLAKGVALVGTSVGAYFLFKQSAVPVVVGAIGYIGASTAGWTESKAIAAAVAGAGLGFVGERALKQKKDDTWCKEHYIQALWDDRCAGADLGEAYGYLSNMATRPGRYECIWRGAKDSTSGDSVSSLIELLHANKFIPTSYPKVPSGKYLGGGEDAVFDASVDNAVKSFQASKGLLADGVVGRNTWRALGVIDPMGVMTKDCPVAPSKKDYVDPAIRTPEYVTDPPKTAADIPAWAWVAGFAGVGALGVLLTANVKAKRKTK
jgi:hypothetical protein